MYRVHTVVTGHRIGDIKQKWKNSKWRREEPWRTPAQHDNVDKECMPKRTE